MDFRLSMNEPTTVEALEQVLWDIYIATGADADGLSEPPRGTSTPVEEIALDAVRGLRQDYDDVLRTLS